MHKQHTPKATKTKSKKNTKIQHRSIKTKLSRTTRKSNTQTKQKPNQLQRVGFSADSLGFSWPVSKQLDGVVNLERFAIQPSAIVEQLWSDYHASSSTAVGFSINSEEFEKLKQRGPNTAFFIHPIPRDGGYFVMLSQYQDKSFLITYLEDFKQNPTKAQPYLTITLYDELQHSKDLVFVRSDICALATMNKQESEVLTRTIIKSYTDDAMYNNVFTFNKQPDQFNFDEYVKQIVQTSDV